MEDFNEYVVIMEIMSRLPGMIKKSKALVLRSRGFRRSLKPPSEKGGRMLKKIEALTEDWKRVHLENKALESQMVAQRERIAALEVERDRDVRRASRIARRDIVAKHREVLESLKGRWASKKNETSAEILLQEVVANINLLIELKDGGLTVDGELSRLKEMERDCADLLASATVPDWSIYELDLPQVSDDSVDQVGGSSVPDDSASS